MQLRNVSVYPPHACLPLMLLMPECFIFITFSDNTVFMTFNTLSAELHKYGHIHQTVQFSVILIRMIIYLEVLYITQY